MTLIFCHPNSVFILDCLHCRIKSSSLNLGRKEGREGGREGGREKALRGNPSLDLNLRDCPRMPVDGLMWQSGYEDKL